MKDKVTAAFCRRYGRQPEIVVRAPGRINLLGEHVDYNDGWVLPAAIDRAVWLAAAPAPGEITHLHALDLDQQAELPMATLLVGERPIGRKPLWSDYPAGVAWALADAGLRPVAIDATYASDVPIGAGVSSSAAVEEAFILAWQLLSGLELASLERARLGQRTENGYLGVRSGIMDQFASVHGAAGHFILLDCRTLGYELIPAPGGTAVLVADSGVRRELARSEYNVRRAQCEEALAILQDHLPGIRALRDVSPEAFALHARRLPEVVRRRARHVIEECARVLSGAAALRQGDLATIGRAIRDSHISCRDLYEISIAELNVLAEAAWAVPGCYGARLTGAGFGGCVIALVDKDAAAAAGEAMRQAYRRDFGRTPDIFACEVAAGAGPI
jgi:galactokinase